MKMLSDGSPSTLKTYRAIALTLSGDKNSKAVKFFDQKIAESPNGEDEVVLQHETQVLYLIGTML